LKLIVITLDDDRLKCKDCKIVRQAKIGFAEPGKSYIRKLKVIAVDKVYVGAAMGFLTIGGYLRIETVARDSHFESCFSAV